MTRFVWAILYVPSSQLAISTVVHIGVDVEQWTKLLIRFKLFPYFYDVFQYTGKLKTLTMITDSDKSITHRKQIFQNYTIIDIFDNNNKS